MNFEIRQIAYETLKINYKRKMFVYFVQIIKNELYSYLCFIYIFNFFLIERLPSSPQSFIHIYSYMYMNISRLFSRNDIDIEALVIKLI